MTGLARVKSLADIPAVRAAGWAVAGAVLTLGAVWLMLGHANAAPYPPSGPHNTSPVATLPPPSGGPGQHLASTGAGNLPLFTLLGVILLVLGGAVLAVVRRRP